MGFMFSDTQLRQKFDAFPYWKSLVFILIICQRLMPSFRAFSEQTGYAGEKSLAGFIEKAWNTLSTGTSSVDYSSEMRAAEALAPDTENFESPLVSSALDTAVAVSLLMKAFKVEETGIAVDVATLIRDSIDMYIQDLEQIDSLDPKLEEKILNHGLMQKELIQQRKDLEFLGGLDDDILVSMPMVRSRWKNAQSSCLGLSI